MKPAAIARAGIVQVPETRELFGDLSVRENLDLGGQHFPKAESARQRDWLYELFPILKARETQSARTLSGGEQQMLTIARALMMRPRLLILDEPTLGLAPVILELLSKPWRSCGRPRRSRSCSASRTSPSRSRTPTGSTCWSRPGSSGRGRRSASPARWDRPICEGWRDPGRSRSTFDSGWSAGPLSRAGEGQGEGSGLSGGGAPGTRVAGLLDPESSRPSPQPSPARERGPVAPRVKAVGRRAAGSHSLVRWPAGKP